MSVRESKRDEGGERDARRERSETRDNRLPSPTPRIENAETVEAAAGLRPCARFATDPDIFGGGVGMVSAKTKRGKRVRTTAGDGDAPTEPTDGGGAAADAGNHNVVGDGLGGIQLRVVKPVVDFSGAQLRDAKLPLSPTDGDLDGEGANGF